MDTWVVLTLGLLGIMLLCAWVYKDLLKALLSILLSGIAGSYANPIYTLEKPPYCFQWLNLFTFLPATCHILFY